MKSWTLFVLMLTFFGGKSQYELEWTKNMGFEISVFSIWKDQILVASGDKKGARFSLINSSGEVILTDTSTHLHSNINFFKRDDNFLYEVGLTYKKRVASNGKLLETHHLRYGMHDGKLLDIRLSNQVIHKNSIYGSFFHQLYKYDLKGNELLRIDVGTSGQIQKVSISEDHIYLYSVIYEAPGTGIFKYDTLGNRIWQVNPGMIVSNIVTDSLGNCFLLGSGVEAPYGIRKLNQAGEQLWWETYPDVILRNGRVLGNSLYVCGFDLTHKNAMYAIISTQTGEILEKVVLPFDALGESGGFSHIFATNNAVYVAGNYGQYFPLTAFIAKFSDPRYVAVNENKLQTASIQVFPNPASYEINVTLIDWKLKEKVTLSLRDQLGRIIVEQHQQNSTFNNDQFKISAPGAKGIYFLTVSDGEKDFTEKVIFD